MKTIAHPAGKWLLAAVIVIYPLHLAAGSVIYVDASATGANNGSSWANAYKYLQNGLTAAGSGDSIWVAQGTYKPDTDTSHPTGTNDRTATFQLKTGVAIYGGYPSGGGSRNPNTYQTILSGDINVADNNSDNSYHVVTSSGTNSTAILDGFTVTKGNADGSSPHIFGGGIYNQGGSPTLANCTFSENSAKNHGGGMSNSSSSSPILTNCTFSRNYAQYDGGGMVNEGSGASPTLTKCTFSENQGGRWGGGMHNGGSSSPILTSCIFIGNICEWGGGTSNITGTNSTLVNCTFSGNTANLGGGGMYNNGSGSTNVTNCTFTGNSSINYYGGGINISASSSLTLTNCVLWGNTATSGAQLYNSASTLGVSYCDVQGGWSGTGNINSNPLFVDADGPDNIFGTQDDNLRLSPGSPCIDAGNNTAVPGGITTDLDGTFSRFIDDPWTDDTGSGTPPIVDMGAYEYRLVIFVDANATGANNGSSWANAHKYLKDALMNAAGSGSEIWVAQSTYRPDRDTNHPSGTSSRAATFQLENGVSLYGGFPSGGGTWESRDPNIHQTILSGDIGTPTVNTDNSYHVVTGSGTDSNTILDGFTITAGNANGSSPHYAGGGMFNDYGNPTVNNCIFSSNSADSQGGGMRNWHSSPTLTNCDFLGNSAPINCGGGIYNYYSSSTITNCTFVGNSSCYGGGIYNNKQGDLALTNCTFIGNSASYAAGGIYNESCDPKVTNCTFGGNSASTAGGGVENYYSSLTLTNCILWGNTAPTGSQIYNYTEGYSTVSYSDVQGGYSGTGNINSNPLFVDVDGPDNISGTEDDNLRLLFGSPCIDSGDNTAVPEEIETDLDGLSRFFDDPRTADTGNGTPPIVDMGAYEYQPVIYVDANATGANDGSSWEDAYNYLQDALWSAESGAEIWVAQGTYRPDEDTENQSGTGDREATFQLINGVAIYGGFPTGGGTWASRDPNTYKTILSGDLDSDDANVSDPCNLLTEPTRAENSYHIVTGSYTDATATLDGFTIKGGNANNSGVWPDNCGGGMFIRDANCTVNNCTFIENSSEWGGAVNNHQSNAHINNCTFFRNAAYDGGGGIELYQSNHPVVVNCDFISNKAYASGANAGGLYNIQSNTEVNNCSFSNNFAPYGGAISNVVSSSPIITDCNFIGNSAANHAGGMNTWDHSTPMLTNCTFSGNSASYGGGGMWVDNNSSATLTDCNFIGNSADAGGGIFIYTASVINVGVGGSVSIKDGFCVTQDSQVWGTGSVVVGLGGEMIIDSDAVVDMNDPNDPNVTGTIYCDGLLNVKGNAQLKHADVSISRQEGGVYGKFKVEGNAQATNLDIYTDGDRFMEVDPCTFTGVIADNRIYVTITEGQNKTPEGVLEVRGLDLPSPPCGPNQVCQIDANTMPPFDINSWTLEQLEVVPGARVTLMNRFSSGFGDVNEVLFVKNLILGADCNLNVGFEHLYYTTLTGDINSIVKTSLLEFSLGFIDFDNNEVFESRVSNNNFIHPTDPNLNRIHVDRVVGLEPDPNGMMRLRNLEDANGQMISARAKAEFEPAVEDEVRIRFKYLFNDPCSQIVVYLSNVPEMEDLNNSYIYTEVARVTSPPPPRPGSPGSNRFGVFDKFVSTGGLDLSQGTWVELVLLQPESGGMFFAESGGQFGTLDDGNGVSVYVNNLEASVDCYWGYCLDLNWDFDVSEADFLMVISGVGGSDAPCLEGPFSDDGYTDEYDTESWDWTLNIGGYLSFCDHVPMTEGGGSFMGSGFGHFGGNVNPLGLSDVNDLLISGKRGADEGPTKLKDHLYVFDSNFHYLRLLEPLVPDRCNTRIVRGESNDLYRINSEEGVMRLDDTNTPVVPKGQTTFANEPRYEQSATVYVGIQGEGPNSFGRPIFDAAFDSSFVYVVPVVVVPGGDSNFAYAAAAKLQLDPCSNPPYHVMKLYDEPPLPGDNQLEYRNTLREIELDDAGNVYVTNSHIINDSDILWKFEPNGAVHRLDLDLSNPCVRAPTGMCLSRTTNVLYLASSFHNQTDPNSMIYGFSKQSLSPVRFITVSGMQHITSITEDPITGALWVAGFNFNSTPEYPDPEAPPFYDPFLAKVPLGVNNVSAVSILGADDLAMPLSICWTGALPEEEPCGGADLDGNGNVTLSDFARLALYWLNTNCAPLNNCEGADLEPEIIPDGDVDLEDLDVFAEHWLDTGCLGP